MQPKGLSEMITNFRGHNLKIQRLNVIRPQLPQKWLYQISPPDLGGLFYCPFALQTLANVMSATRHSCVSIRFDGTTRFCPKNMLYFQDLFVIWFTNEVFFCSQLRKTTL
jgi:hypothetical protein